jgi:hypothetical protein
MIVQAYLQASRDALRGIVRNPIALVGIFALQVVFVLSGILFAPLGDLLGGTLRSFLFLILLTIGYGVCETIHQARSKIRFDDFKQLDWSLFSALINVGFILWLTSYLLQVILPPSGREWIVAAFNILALFVLNPAPEVAILKRLDSMEAVTYCFEFMKRRSFEWVLPIVILLSPVFYLSGTNVFFLRSAGADVLLPAPLLLSGVVDTILFFTRHSSHEYLIIALIGVIHSVLGLWIVLFRLSLFERLERFR